MKKIIQLFSILTLVVLYSFNNQTFSQNNYLINTNDTSISRIVENQPDFQGGEKARVDFLRNNMHYPDKAIENGIEGIVYITFVVEKDGSITNIKILRGIGGGCDEEAVRVIKLMPKWIPGNLNGSIIRTQYNMPIKFTITNENIKKENKKENKEKQ
ncbi:MAG: energy transducer TonB [Bacteroidales bacterium]